MRGLLLLLLVTPCFLSAQLKCADIFSDHMVLQRDEPVSIWGKGVPGKVVEVKFNTVIRKATVKTDSSWMVAFQPQALNRSPQNIVVTSNKERLILRNILIGDLWLCMGQSNMEWPMKSEAHYKEEISKCNQPVLRFYNPTYAGKGVFGEPYADAVLQQLNAGNFYTGKWQVSDSISFKEMSAVAYYFGKEIIQHTGIPTGLIHLAIGGAPIETFIDHKILEKDAQFVNKVKGNWLQNNTLPVWVRERGAQNIPVDLRSTKNETGPAHPYKPGYAYETGIEPILNFPVKGILWYQGESNAQEIERVSEYRELMKLMVNDYRSKWKKPALPFYFIQLSSVDTARYNGRLWPVFRDEQRKAMHEIQHSGMVVSSDVGARHDVHPRNKKTPGQRLARWALKNEYHRAIIPGGPLPVKAVFANGQVIINFHHTGNSLQTSSGENPKGFSLDGISETEATVEKDVVVIKTQGKPDSIYYGWKPFTEANLINEAGLPASTFKIAVQQLPSLLPLPQQVRWTHAQFPLNACKTMLWVILHCWQLLSYYNTSSGKWK